MASQPSALTGWAKRALANPVAKPIGYSHVPEDESLMNGAECVPQARQVAIILIDTMQASFTAHRTTWVRR